MSTEHTSNVDADSRVSLIEPTPIFNDHSILTGYAGGAEYISSAEAGASVSPGEPADTHPGPWTSEHPDIESGQPSVRSSQHPETPLDSRSNTEQVAGRTDDSKTLSVWRRAWITPASLIGFYVLAMLCAIAHLCIFEYLDGRIADQGSDPLPFPSTSIPQSYVTTVSLILVTIFRASLVAAIGICYTKHLWQTLRRQFLEVGLIEELFQIRANALRLLNLAILHYTPSLLFIATLSWLMPIATVYPPGALTVGLEVREVQEQLNVSVIPSSGKLQRTGQQKISDEREADFPTFGKFRPWPCTDGEFCLMLNGPSYPLEFLAKSALVNRGILEIQGPSRANASYSMKFPGPRMQCQEKEGVNVTLQEIYSYNHFMLVGSPAVYDWWSMKLSSDSWNITLEDSPDGQLSIAPCPEQSSEQPFDPQVFRPYRRLECVAATAEYTVEIGFSNGFQSIHYTVGEVHPLNAPPYRVPLSPETDANNADYTPLQSWEEHVNVMSLIGSLVLNFDVAGRFHSGAYDTGGKPLGVQPFRLSNGTFTQACTLNEVRKEYVGGDQEAWSIFQLSVFNTDRFLEQNTTAGNIFVMSEFENLLNEALANITISALTLNNWFDIVNGTGTRVYNTYRFHRQLNFFLPYGLCLLFTLPVVAIGLISLRNNDVSAIDGGFLQILMTAATGRTELEIAASKGHLGGYENVPKELRNLKVRFGELVTPEDTTEEARVLNTRPQIRSSEEHDTDVNQSGEDISLVPMSQERQSSETQDGSSGRAEVASGIEEDDLENVQVRRAGFGVFSETRPLRRGSM